jgi:hypothetical protein
MPTNGDATRVHCLTAAGTGTSGLLVTFNTVHRHLEAFGAEMTYGAISHRPEGSPLHSTRPQLSSGQSSAMPLAGPCKMCECTSQLTMRNEGS